MEAGQITYRAEAEIAPSEALAMRVIRRIVDVAVALALLVVTLPLLLLIALLVRIESPGSPLFRQRRIGRDEHSFVVNKFRTMRSDAEATPHREYVKQLLTGNGVRHSAGDKSLFKLAVDDRVTRVGRFLRRTSLDELPQLWNVLRGEMSLVGPRPVIPYEVEYYPTHYRRRFAVKPGMTGLWQVSGRSERSYEEMVALDLEYVESRSLRLDTVILLKTAWVVLARRGAA